ncbi:MAG: indolepyruvate ferredoxin oxidoreductase subunit alpha [Lachnospiraceae bacterium]
MTKSFLMGNEAIGLGAIRAGVGVVTGYPGTPSTEVLETIAKNNPGNVYVEWSVNEKAALEVAAGAAYTGTRTMVTMKQVGLNVASDPLMSLAYVGVKGGMVIVAADDPGPISSQTEQDTRHFAQFCKLPVFDPCSPEEAYEMIGDAFTYSEKYHTPVLFRPTTRICHGCASIELKEKEQITPPEGFIKDASKWVIFPKLSYQNHQMIEQRLPQIGNDFSNYQRNEISGSGVKGIITGGISYAYVKEALNGYQNVKILKVATPHPFPQKLALEFLDGLTEVLSVEELDPVLEKELLLLCGTHHLQVDILGKLTNHVKNAGENSVESVSSSLEKFLQVSEGTLIGSLKKTTSIESIEIPTLPIRPPVLCAGCSHRASFYVVKRALEGQESVFCGDIGCYTLGNAKPLEMVDTCLCMGAGITIAQGIGRVEPYKKQVAFVGDSTFFAAGITGIINAVYNEADLTVVILDNSTTAMTGHQPHPGTGKTMMGHVVDKINIEQVLHGIGIQEVAVVNPLELETAIQTFRKITEKQGVKAIIFRSPCIALLKNKERMTCEINQDICVQCQACIREIGCPALSFKNDLVGIDKNLCNGCGLCTQICSVHAIQ